jgi:hypothetical protein
MSAAEGIGATIDRDDLAAQVDLGKSLARRMGLRLGDARQVYDDVEKALACHDSITQAQASAVYAATGFIITVWEALP